MTVRIIQGNALDLPLPDDSVDLVVTSPPYFGLRSYRDGGEHYDGQVGSEATPAEFVDALIAATREMVRVTKPTGSIWVNLGDKFSIGNSGQSGMAALGAQYRGGGHSEAKAKQRSGKVEGVPPKSLLGIPWRYAIRCMDELGLILRAEVIWDKPNALPESVRDRVRRNHETWFHFTLSPRYYANVDEIREPSDPANVAHAERYGMSRTGNTDRVDRGAGRLMPNPLGKLPGSVWRIATQPLRVPAELGIDHFAAFPMEWPRRIITGWSPPGICTACREGRRAVVTSGDLRPAGNPGRPYSPDDGRTLGALRHGVDGSTLRQTRDRTLTGYACACPTPDAPTSPAVVLDPFGGTGTTALVADVLGRDGISVDLSADYCRLATWRTNDPKERARVLKVKAPAKPKLVPEPLEPDIPQDDLFGGAA